VDIISKLQACLPFVLFIRVLLFICYIAVVDYFYRPKLARAIACSVEKMVVRVGSSLEKFETELCLTLQNEHCQPGMIQAGGSAQVLKRYMRVLSVYFI